MKSQIKSMSYNVPLKHHFSKWKFYPQKLRLQKTISVYLFQEEEKKSERQQILEIANQLSFSK